MSVSKAALLRAARSGGSAAVSAVVAGTAPAPAPVRRAAPAPGFPALPVAPAGPGAGPVYFARSRSYRVRPFVVYVPKSDLRYVGCMPTERFDTAEQAQARVDELRATNSYAQDAAGWWRPVAS